MSDYCTKKTEPYGKHEALFDGLAKVLLTNREFGPTNYKRESFERDCAKALELIGKDRVLVLPIVFGVGVERVTSIPAGVFTPESDIDGVIVNIEDDIPVMQTNADCSVIKILTPNGDLAVLHGSIYNVDNELGSIVNVALDMLEGDPSTFRMHVGEGAGPCCFGYEEPRGREDRLPTGIVEKGPRKGVVSFDIPQIAAAQARARGVEDISVDSMCTSCCGGFCSHLRGDTDDRNMCIVYSS